MVKLADRVKVVTSTVGTGPIALGAAVSGYQTLADGGILNGDTVRYVIEDGNNWEIGTGTYNSTGPTMSRTVIESSNSNSPLTLTGNASVFLSISKTDLQRAADMDQSLKTTDTPTFAGLSLSSLTLDGAPITATGVELNYSAGVTTFIQDQLDDKQATVTGAATTILSSDLAINRVVVTDAAGKVNVSAVTTAELNILDGATVTTAELNLLDGATSLGPTTPGTTTDGGVVLFDGTDGSALKDGGAQDAVIHGLTIGRGASGGVATTSLGYEALQGETTDASAINTNTAVGYRAGFYITSGVNNVAIGPGALAGGILGNDLEWAFDSVQPVTGDSNVAIGLGALGRCLSGDRNVAVGDTGGVLAGNYNTLIGGNTGPNLTTTDPTDFQNNTLIGYQAGSFTSPFSSGSSGNRIVLGNNSVTNAYIKVAWTVTSDERDKTDFAALSQGLDVVDAIDTFTFKFDNRSSYFVYDEDGNIIDTPAPDGTHKSDRTFVGFKAQQVQSVLDAAGFPSDVVVDTEDPENLKMKETALIPLLINAIKELKARVEALEAAP